MPTEKYKNELRKREVLFKVPDMAYISGGLKATRTKGCSP